MAKSVELLAGSCASACLVLQEQDRKNRSHICETQTSKIFIIASKKLSSTRYRESSWMLAEQQYENELVVDQPVALAHIACDRYQSVLTCLRRSNLIWSQVVSLSSTIMHFTGLTDIRDVALQSTSTLLTKWTGTSSFTNLGYTSCVAELWKRNPPRV